MQMLFYNTRNQLHAKIKNHQKRAKKQNSEDLIQGRANVNLIAIPIPAKRPSKNSRKKETMNAQKP